MGHYCSLHSGFPLANLTWIESRRDHYLSVWHDSRPPVWDGSAPLSHCSHTGLGNGADFHVHARGLAAFGVEHAVPVDLRRQRRRLHGALPVLCFLPPLRGRGGRGTGGDEPWIDATNDRGEWRHLWCARRLFPPVPAGHHTGPILFGIYSDRRARPSLDLPRSLVCRTNRERNLFRPERAGGSGLGACRRIPYGHGPRTLVKAKLSQAASAAALTPVPDRAQARSLVLRQLD
jgi:hypothetical protein